jgi:hypothetical protein
VPSRLRELVVLGASKRTRYGLPQPIRGLDRNPEQWDVAQVLYAALRIDDHPGAISIGEPQAEMASRHPIALNERGPRYDTLATDVSATLPAGASAGGEQSKFLAVLDSGEHVLVKFTPPRGTPFGER